MIDTLRAAGVEVVIGTSEKSKEIMHNKFTVIDGRIVQDGSWNYTRAANRQANVLNFVDDYDRAQRFLRYWERMHKFMKTQPQDLPDVTADKDDDDEEPHISGSVRISPQHAARATSSVMVVSGFDGVGTGCIGLHTVVARKRGVVKLDAPRDCLPKDGVTVKVVTSTTRVGKEKPRYSYDTLRLEGSYDLA